MYRPLKRTQSSTLSKTDKDNLFWTTISTGRKPPPPEIRFDHTDHVPIRVQQSNGGACQMEGCDKIASYRCLKCNAFLCIGLKKMTNCFYWFHNEAAAERPPPTKKSLDNATVDLDVIETPFDDPLSAVEQPLTFKPSNKKIGE